MILRGFVIRIYPDEEQEKILNRYCDATHHIWNKLVEKYKGKLPVVGKYGIKDFTVKQIQTEFGYEDIPNRVIESVVQYYCQGLQKFYDGYNIKPPRFHKYDSKKRSFGSYHVKWKVKNGTIPLPHTQYNDITANKRIKADKERINSLGVQVIKSAKFFKKGGKWVVSGSYDDGKVAPSKTIGREVLGLDWGIGNFITTSSGDIINYPESVEKMFFRIKRLRRVLANKNVGSRNYIKLENKINRLYRRYDNLKDNFIKQTVKRLLDDNDIAIEGLNRDQIFRNDKMNNKYILFKQGTRPLSRFVRHLGWVSKRDGRNVYKVDPYNTSKTCNRCGKIKFDLTLNDRIYICSCGYVEDRDINAAKNIRDAALKSI